MPYVYSTLTSGQDYLNYTQGPADIKIPEGDPVRIDGGHGLANKKLVTPLGVATKVSDEELAYLMRNPVFLAHEKAGFVSISDHKTDPERVAADMKLRDGSSPMTPADYTNAPASSAKPRDEA